MTIWIHSATRVSQYSWIHFLGNWCSPKFDISIRKSYRMKKCSYQALTKTFFKWIVRVSQYSLKRNQEFFFWEKKFIFWKEKIAGIDLQLFIIDLVTRVSQYSRRKIDIIILQKSKSKWDSRHILEIDPLYDGILLINWIRGYSRYGSGKSGNQVRTKYLDRKTLKNGWKLSIVEKWHTIILKKF